MGTLLSIIIPTKNRYEYLIEVLKILCRYKSEEFEIVVQDNSDEGKIHDSFMDFLVEFNDKRIKYFYNSCHLSINENSDKAILNSCGKYVCFIGDDDCVVSQIVQVAEWMEKEYLDVVTFHCPIYIWTDVEFKYLGKKHTGVLTYKKPTGKFEIRSPQKELTRLLKMGGQDLSDMPQLYHGIAARKVLNEIFKSTGSYFPGSVPDMDVAVGLSLYANKFCKIDAPVVISGTAKRSAGGLGAAKLHKGEIKEIKTLPEDTADTWNPLNPFFWSAPTIYADSIYKCLKRTGNKKKLDLFNYNYLYATLLIFNYEYYSRILRTINKNRNASYFKIIIIGFRLFVIRTHIFIKNRMSILFRNKHERFYFSNISDVVIHLEGIITNINAPWTK